MRAIIVILALCTHLCGALSSAMDQAGLGEDLLQIRALSVGGNSISWRPGKPARLPSVSEDVRFSFGASSNATRPAMRLRYRLEGYDPSWREGHGEMYLAVRFLNESLEQISRTSWKVTGDSPGWSGDLVSAPLNHRREVVQVPAGASHIQVVITSAGPPATVGIYVVDDLVVSKLSSDGTPSVLLRTPFSAPPPSASINVDTVPVWDRQGMRPSMAKVIEIGRSPSKRALAVLDEDPHGHAEWINLKNQAPRVNSGDQLLLEWNELYSMGVASDSVATYKELPPGNFQFYVAEVTALGLPTGAQACLPLVVALPFWKTPWCWALCAAFVIAAAAATGRHLAGRRIRRHLLRLEQERILEQERLRIAQNIHDDLGARITQISLLSGVSQNNPQFPEKAREAFDTISRMSRDLVAALYETVWAVNPENDNLEALGNYLCQMVEQLGHSARLRCRLHLLDLPPEIQVSSHTRHHLTLAVKEAVHNAIKHARASEITLRVSWSEEWLTVCLHDNGLGFLMSGEALGHGLSNMKSRLAALGGSCLIQSEAGGGTNVQMRLKVGRSKQKHLNPVPALTDGIDRTGSS